MGIFSFQLKSDGNPGEEVFVSVESSRSCGLYNTQHSWYVLCVVCRLSDVGGVCKSHSRDDGPSDPPTDPLPHVPVTRTGDGYV
jgi:hypothetical protein